MFEFLFEINNVRIILAVVMLTIASFFDILKREINDLLWIIFGAIALVLIFFEPNIIEFIVNTGISLIIVPVALLIWRVGIFGGADAFALIVLAVLAPQISLSENFVTPLTTLTNAVIISTVPIFLNLFQNLFELSRHKDIFEGFKETRFNKICALFLGHKAKNPKYSFSIERVEGEYKKIEFSFHHAENSEFCTKPNTWVTQGIPYVLYITAGFIVQILMGDIIFSIVNFN